jgi:hypothetical protein
MMQIRQKKHEMRRLVVLTAVWSCILALACSESDPVNFRSHNYTAVPSEATLWDTIADLADSGLSIVIEVDRGEAPFDTGAVQGRHCYVDVTMTGGNELVCGFELLLGYDPKALIFQTATFGDKFSAEGCGWEYFNYRFGSATSCPDATLRFTGIAETANGPHHPTCYRPEMPATMFTVDFLVTNDPIYESAFVPIKFYWQRCDDNGIAFHPDNDSGTFGLAIETAVWTHNGTGYAECTTVPTEFPTYFGAMDSCIEFQPPNRPLRQRCLHLFNGGVQIARRHGVGEIGDVNLNMRPFEIADAVVFKNYFIEGEATFRISVERQSRATDANRDGDLLTIADLVYMFRIIIGDAVPYNQLEPEASIYRYENDTLSIHEPVGAVFVLAPGNVTPVNLTDSLEIGCSYDGTNTHILLSSLSGMADSGQLLYLPGGYTQIEAATPQGAEMALVDDTATIRLWASPNPFEDSTTISFDWKYGDNYLIVIYDVSGKEVAGFSSHAGGSFQSVVWRAENIDAGVYFARLLLGKEVVARTTILKTQ